MDFLNMMHFVYAMHRISKESAAHRDLLGLPANRPDAKEKSNKGQADGEVHDA